MIPGATLSLEIHQQYARLGLNIQKPQLQIRQPKAELEIRQVPARMEIDQGPGMLLIDGEEARAALGLKSPFRMTADIAAQARQVAMEAIGNYAEEGDQLAQIEKGTSIANVALQRQGMGPMPIADFGPPSPVRITYTPYPFRIDWILGGADISAIPRPPVIDYTPGAVQAYLAQRNSIQIDVKGQYMNMTF